MYRLLPLLLLFFLGTCVRAPRETAAAGDRPPNIVFILTDDQGYGDLWAHGNPWLRTPHLDALHDASVRLTNFHVATTCAPTRAGLLAGVNCNRAGAWHTIAGRSMLATRFATLADELRAAGYATGIFGKWHLGDNYPFRPQDRGFDEVVIHGGGGVGQTPDYWSNDYFDDTYFHNGVPERYPGYCTDVWFAEGMKFMEERAAAGQPFFAYLATNAPHGPFHVAEKYASPYRDNPAIPNPEFYGMIANVDENVGKLMARLRATGLDENTLVVFMTDNGTAAGAAYDAQQHVVRGFNAGMRGKKGDEYEGGHRVPCFLRFPAGSGVRPAAFAQLTTYTDFMPTLLDYVGSPAARSAHYDGTSLLPLLTTGDQPALADRIRVVDTQRELYPVRGKQSCVMQDRWRLINGRELYDLSADPGQREDLAARYPERVGRLRAAYEVWWDGMAEDLKVNHRIVVGHAAEPRTLLTAHDWRTTNPPPWNQRHVRAALVDNGHWAIDVARAGNYRIRLYRYPPEADLPLSAVAPAGEEVPNGRAYAPGTRIVPTAVRCTVGAVELATTTGFDGAYVEFTAALPRGPANLSTTVTAADGAQRGAYYVTLELVD